MIEDNWLKLKNLMNEEKNATYRDRLVVEYKELEDRCGKLEKMLNKYRAGTLDFTPTCPIELLEYQLVSMEEYLKVLYIRTKIEGVEIKEQKRPKDLSNDEVEGIVSFKNARNLTIDTWFLRKDKNARVRLEKGSDKPRFQILESGEWDKWEE